MDNSNNNHDYYSNYNGFEKISKAKNHVITVKSPHKVGVCDLNSNCSNIELDISQIRNNRFNQPDSLNIASTQSNKIISNNNQQKLESNVIIYNNNDKDNDYDNDNDNDYNKDNDENKENFTNNSSNSIFNLDNIIIVIFILLILFYLIKKRNKK
jgi:hypothetical protein